jgi:hypothetical protein
MEKLHDSNTPHRDRSTRENDVFSDMIRLGPDTDGIKVPIVLTEDNDQIHIGEHDKFIVSNSDDLLQNEWLFQMVLLHNEQHKLQLQEKQGNIPLGSKMQAPAMMAQARQKPAPTMPEVYQGTMQMTQSKMQAQQAQQHQLDQRDPNQSAGKTPTGKRVEKEIQQNATQPTA